MTVAAFTEPWSKRGMMILSVTHSMSTDHSTVPAAYTAAPPTAMAKVRR